MSDGLLGGKYVSIFPGASEDYLTNGDEIHYTQDSMNLETLLGKFAFGSVGSEESEDATSSSDGGL
jgi:phospholipid/cholesterol/gamma-HCH transport system substrate-binding protein